jgi:hypothetical protein
LLYLFFEGAKGDPADALKARLPDLAVAYSVIASFLRHQSEVRACLGQRQRQGAHIREENERRFNLTGIRDRLLGRRG